VLFLHATDCETVKESRFRGKQNCVFRREVETVLSSRSTSEIGPFWVAAEYLSAIFLPAFFHGRGRVNCQTLSIPRGEIRAALFRLALLFSRAFTEAVCMASSVTQSAGFVHLHVNSA